MKISKKTIWQEIELGLREDAKVRPNWPDHVCAQSAIVSAEAGKILDASLSIKYLKGKKDQANSDLAKKAAIKTAVAAIRFIENLSND